MLLETKEKDLKGQPLPAEENERVNGGRLEELPQGYVGSDLEEEEVDISDLINQIWKRRKIVIFTTLFTFILGICIALYSPEEYEANIMLMPQASSTSGNVASGLLRQFGGLAGLNLDNGSAGGTLSPNLYPEITQSTPFFLHMMREEVYFPTLDTTVTLLQYFSEIQQPTVLDYIKQYTIGLPKIIFNTPARIINSIKDKHTPVPTPANNTAAKEETVAMDTINDSFANQPIAITGRQLSVINKLKSRITTTIEPNGTVNVSVEMPDPLVAAKTTEMAVKYLTNYILEYRTEKAQQDLGFVEKQYNEKKEKYNAAQQKLARFQDRNTNIYTENARIELERLRTENNLAFNLYQGLAQQLEQAKIKVQEETPIFKVLEPIQVPLSKSKPDREMIITLSLFVGIFLGLGIIFMGILFASIKSKIV